MQGDVGPGAEGEGGGVFPGLEAVGVEEVVGGFPVVEGFVAVLERVVEGGEGVAGEEEEEGEDKGGWGGRHGGGGECAGWWWTPC